MKRAILVCGSPNNSTAPFDQKSLQYIPIFLYKIASKLIFMRSFKYYVRIEIDNSDLGVIGDFATINALESLRLCHRDPNIANRCKISYNPSLVVVYFYINHVSRRKVNWLVGSSVCKIWIEVLLAFDILFVKILLLLGPM